MRRSFILASCFLACSAVPAASADNGWHSVQRDGQRMITGSGRIVSQQRPVGSFSRIELRGSTDLEVRLGVAPSLSIRADDNIVGLVTSRIENGTLIIDTRGSFRTRSGPKAFVTVPNLEYVSSRGSGNTAIAGVANRHLELMLQGSGNISAAGRTQDLRVALRGSGDIDTRDLSAASADVQLNGSGNARVDARRAVNARLFGSGNIYVSGQPGARNVRESGSGNVIFSS